MDLSTPPNLVAAIADTLNRNDLNDVIPTWVKLFELQANRMLRTTDMIKRKTVTTTDQYVIMPSGLLELKEFQVNSPSNYRGKLLMSSAEDLDDLRNWYPNGGRPTRFTVVGKSLEFGPAPDKECVFELTYYEAITGLDCSNAASTNWLFASSPDVYLYGALTHSAPFLGEDGRLQVWGQMASAALDALNVAAERQQHSGSRLNMRPQTFG